MQVSCVTWKLEATSLDIHMAAGTHAIISVTQSCGDGCIRERTSMKPCKREVLYKHSNYQVTKRQSDYNSLYAYMTI